MRDFFEPDDVGYGQWSANAALSSKAYVITSVTDYTIMRIDWRNLSLKRSSDFARCPLPHLDLMNLRLGLLPLL